MRRTKQMSWAGALALFTFVGIGAGSAGAAGHGSAGGGHSAPAWQPDLQPPALVAAAARGRVYGGTTSQIDPLVMTLSKDGRRVIHVTEEFEAPCAGGAYYPFADDEATSWRISRSGAFKAALSDSVPLSSGTTAVIKGSLSGRVRGRTITGSSTVHVGVVPAAAPGAPPPAEVDSCDLSFRYKLTSAAGRQLGGASSQHLPVLVVLTRSRSRVSRFHIGWRATCSPEGLKQVGDAVTNFPLKAGRFGDSWRSTLTKPGQDTLVLDYSLKGRLKRGSASGSFSVTVTERNPATGAVDSTCSSGRVSWRTASG